MVQVIHRQEKYLYKYMPYYNDDSINLNLLFLHIPKTGGTSVEQYFSNKFNIPLNTKSLWGNIPEYRVSMQHLTHKTIIKHKTILEIDTTNLSCITIVRNPYERLISDLFYLKKIKINDSQNKVYDVIFKNYLYQKSGNNFDNHTVPQHLFIIDENNKIIPKLIILRTETLNNDMHKLGYTDFNLKKNANSSSNINYYDYLNNNSINLINNIYHNDFILFNYTKLNIARRNMPMILI
jgi:hypothetical protein